MHIKIISVGKLKEKYLKMGIEEYQKRLRSYCKLELVEVADEKAPETLSEKEMVQVKEKEGERILAKIKPDDYVIGLVIAAEMISSEELAQTIDRLALFGKSSLVLIIGGSLGIGDNVVKRMDQQISFGKLTYPHQLMRLILVEQLYRSWRIIKNEPYHK